MLQIWKPNGNHISTSNENHPLTPLNWTLFGLFSKKRFTVGWARRAKAPQYWYRMIPPLAMILSIAKTVVGGVTTIINVWLREVASPMLTNASAGGICRVSKKAGRISVEGAQENIFTNAVSCACVPKSFCCCCFCFKDSSEYRLICSYALAENLTCRNI